MRKLLLLIPLLSLAVLSATNAVSQKRGKIKGMKSIAVVPVLAELNSQYNEAAKKLRDDQINISITEASVAFSVTESVSAEAGLEIVAIKAGGKRDKSKSTTVTYNFSRPEIKEGLAPSSLRGLSDLIVRAGKEFAGLYKKKGELLGELVPDNFEIAISFGITQEASGGITFLIFSAGGGYSKSQEHSISLKFKITK